jgi:ankyrin repeat protein
MSDELKHIVGLVRSNSLDALRELLKQVPGVAKSPRGRTALHCAAEEGNVEASELLLGAGFDVDARTDDGEKPLHFAARYGRGFDLLLSDPDFNENNVLGARQRRGAPTHPQVMKAFMASLRKRHPEIPAELGIADEIPAALKFETFFGVMGLLLDRDALRQDLAEAGVDVDALDPQFGEMLRGYPRYVRLASLLLERGADVNARNSIGSSPLHEAIVAGELAMVKLLLQRGANPNLPRRNENDQCEPPVDYAIRYVRLDAAKLLFACGARVNFDLCPLHGAAESGRLEMLNWLLEVGGDLNQLNCNGNTPVMSAAAGHHPVVRALCERKAELHHRNAMGQTVLHLAAAWPECLRPLLECGLPINYPDAEGRTPLHYAARSSSESSIPLLVASGASVDAQDSDGNTPLHIIFFGEEFRPDIEFPTFEALVTARANRTLRNKDGKTAFDLATQWHYPREYLRLLKP